MPLKNNAEETKLLMREYQPGNTDRPQYNLITSKQELRLTNTFAAGAPRTAHRRDPEPAPAKAGVEMRNESPVGTLAMSVVHDLRSPLAAIHSGAQILNGPQLPEEQVRRLARNMYNASIRIQEMLQDYLELCRTSESRRLPSNLQGLVADAVRRIADGAEAQSVAVVQDVGADLFVTVERVRIGSVLANLLVNAVEAMPEGGSVHISAAAAGDSVVTRVLDTGPGIAPEIRDRLFQPFATARKPNGWGLGLAQARQVVVDHGGQIWLESSSSRGTCFAFSLPAS